MSTVGLRVSIEKELWENLLPFWRERCIDLRYGGFIGEMANDGEIRADALKGLILNSRILWTFAALHRRFGDPRDLELAHRAYRYLLGHFADREHGGFFWLLDPTGQPVDRTKKIYGQAFCIYALSEYCLATDDAEAKEESKRVFHRIEEHAHDARHGGYIEALSADWSPAADLRLSDKDMNVAKSMNNHLHVLEAYTNLYRIWPVQQVAERLRECLGLFQGYVMTRSDFGWHLEHFFDNEWNVRSDTYTYGHELEAVWLLCEAAEVLEDRETRTGVETQAVGLARSALAEGIDQDGGLAYEGRAGAVIDPNREWWCQAEAVVGLWHAHTLTGEEAFAGAARRVWRFIDSKIVDRRDGEWFWRVRVDGSIDAEEPKVSAWKGPYHNTRMCLEMIRRLENEEQERAR